MSTLKADLVTAVTTDGALKVKGLGSGKVKIGDGELIFPDADGSVNQYIKTDGSGNLAFATPSSADIVLLQTVTITSNTSTASLTAFSNSTYNSYHITIDVVPQTDSESLFAKFSTDGGSSYSGASYSHHRVLGESTTLYGQQGVSQSYINVCGFPIHNVAAKGGASGTMNIFNAGNTAIGTSYDASMGTYRNSSTLYSAHQHGQHEIAQDTDAVQFYMSSGNLTLATFKLYGLK